MQPFSCRIDDFTRIGSEYGDVAPAVSGEKAGVCLMARSGIGV